MNDDLLACLQLMAEHAQEGMIITNSNDTIYYINPSARRLLDYKDDGRLPTVMPTEGIFTGEKPKPVYFNNKALLISVKTVKIKDRSYYCWHISDVSKQEQQKDELYCLKTILDCIDEGVIMSNSESKITFYNKTYALFERLSPEQVIGKHLDEVYNSNEHVKVLKTGIPITDSYKRYITFNGQEQDGIGKTYPVIKDNKVIAAFSVVRNIRRIRWLLQKAVDLQGNLNQNVKSNGTKYTFESIIGESEVMVNTINEAKMLAMSPSPILVYGETGTGKELFAQSIHNCGPCADQPFVAINCAAVPESLLESILFGTVKGSFTGAQNSKGVFEQAGNGTLFLDEINSMPKAMQAKLLRVLQEKTVRRVGATYEIPVKCRIITSSNEQPEECVRNGSLRNDLYYRLAILRVGIPPLSERGGDVEVLAEYFLKNKARLYGKKDIRLSTEFVNHLHQYSWPGNVRELEHTIESCVAVMEDGEEVHLYHLPSHLRHTNSPNRLQTAKGVFQSTSQATTKAAPQSGFNAVSSQDTPFQGGSQATSSRDRSQDASQVASSWDGFQSASFQEGSGAASQTASSQGTPSFDEFFDNLDTPTLAAALREVEKRVVLTSLQNHHWNVSQAAKAIGIGRQNLQYRMRKLNIERP